MTRVKAKETKIFKQSYLQMMEGNQSENFAKSAEKIRFFIRTSKF